MPTSARDGVGYFRGWVNGGYWVVIRFTLSHSAQREHFVNNQVLTVGIGPYSLAELRTVQRTFLLPPALRGRLDEWDAPKVSL